jgi:hypothetical protein
MENEAMEAWKAAYAYALQEDETLAYEDLMTPGMTEAYEFIEAEFPNMTESEAREAVNAIRAAYEPL